MAEIDKLYRNLSNAIINNGYEYQDTSREVTCTQLSTVNLEIGVLKEFPLLTTKNMYTKGIVAELIWFLRGDDNISFLVQNGVNIWNKDAYNHYVRIASQNLDEDANSIYHDNDDGTVRIFTYEEFVHILKSYNREQIGTLFSWEKGNYYIGDVGRNYGVQWRDWGSKDYELQPSDQIENLLDNLKVRPINRRNIVTAWNPQELHLTALPACHWAFEIIPFPLNDLKRIDISGKDSEELTSLWEASTLNNNTVATEKLRESLEGVPTMGFLLKWHQRSVDTFLGLPFNIASYGILGHILDGLTGYKFMGLIGDLSNVHFYEPHIELVNEQVLRDVDKYPGCKLHFSEKIERLFMEFREGNITFDKVLSEFEINDIEFVGYQSYEPLKGEMLAPKE